MTDIDSEHPETEITEAVVEPEGKHGFQVTFECDMQHQQTITFGPGFSKEYVENHAALCAGGEVQLGPEKRIAVPGTPCGICGRKVGFTVAEVPGEAVST